MACSKKGCKAAAKGGKTAQKPAGKIAVPPALPGKAAIAKKGGKRK